MKQYGVVGVLVLHTDNAKPYHTTGSQEQKAVLTRKSLVLQLRSTPSRAPPKDRCNFRF